MLLESAVLHQFGVEAAVAGMADFLEENAVEVGRDESPTLREVNPNRFGLRTGHECTRQQG